MFPSSFPMWTSIDDIFYYNIIKNKDKGSAKRKVTFGQTLITQSLSILNRKRQSGSRYQTRYQTRNNNSPEKSLDDDDSDDDSDQEDNFSLNHQPLNQSLN